jgi:predicted deacylase
MVINNSEIKKGEFKTINLDLPDLYNLPVSIPIHVLNGKKKGPTIFISAAIHGNELNGIEIIRRIHNLSVLKRLRGTLILVPIVNIYGFNSLTRYLPDRRDLNRSFPGNYKGSLTSRVAKVFFEEIVKVSDFGIDLHTGSIHKTNLPQIRTNIKDEFALKLAKAFEAPVILNSELRDGSLRSVAQESNIPVLLYEAGEALRFDELSIKIGVKGIVNVLRELDMLPKTNRKRRPKNPLITKSSQWIRAHVSGTLRTIKKLGDVVEVDEIIAYVDDVFSDQSYEIISKWDGIIIGKSLLPLVQEGDAIFHIAHFTDLGVAENRIEYFQEDAIEKSDLIGLNDEVAIEE